MDTTIITALISAGITIIGVLFAYSQWRRDVQIKLEGLRDNVTVELIKKRIEVYSPFVSKLEQMSSVHREQIINDPRLALKFMGVFHDAIYSPVGLIASSDARSVISYARLGCKLFADGKITFDEWLNRVWAVHLAIRSDLGIIQSQWPDEIKRIRDNAISQGPQGVAERVESTDHQRYRVTR